MAKFFSVDDFAGSRFDQTLFTLGMRRILIFILCGLILSGVRAADDMNAIAERYAHLVLALGQHDLDYVDAFYGPTEWKTQAEKEKKSLDAIGAAA